jgi:hypothetical protein
MTCGAVRWEGGSETLPSDPETPPKAKLPGRTARMATTARRTLALRRGDETGLTWHLLLVA